jgi:hypothetical protein
MAVARVFCDQEKLEKHFGTRSMYSARGDALRLAVGDPSRSDLRSAAPRSDCATIHWLVRFFRYPAGFRNFIPKHAFTRYCWLTTDSLVKRDHGPPAGGRRAFTPRAGRSLWRRPRVRHKERVPLWPTCAAARLLVTRRKSEAIDGLEADENRADVVSLAGPS